jgi:hypothetical protein
LPYAMTPVCFLFKLRLSLDSVPLFFRQIYYLCIVFEK